MILDGLTLRVLQRLPEPVIAFEPPAVDAQMVG
jgi:hypothetical protein